MNLELRIMCLVWFVYVSCDETELLSECGVCDRSKCPTRTESECIAGLTTDKCGCCETCAKSEGDFCDLPGASPLHGQCGLFLDCREVGSRYVCVCQNQDIVCGSNGVEYQTVCKLREDKIRTDNADLIVQQVGRCPVGPTILTGPESVRNVTGDDVVLLCEAYGNPVPFISWMFIRVDGEKMNLPGDDMSISVSSRGGPEKSQLTGWLQIMGAERRHEGDYMCIATNVHGRDEKIGRVKIFKYEKELSRVKRRHDVDQR